ncbi:MAG: hypothetical protein M1828_002409 [Chrysothrix sp. TS-e1954]|nr:MAG: hypothetical protein M1828_002409 [Chrysothrix sp. TS-e1954]
MAALEQEYRDIVEKVKDDTQRVEITPTTSQLLGRFTVICLILNRTIGSGIFTTPAYVLEGTGSVGASLLLWTAGGLIATCGLLVWLEFGLSLPLRKIPGQEGEHNVPRSGGEKNYLEFVFGKPAFLSTCMYGMVFVLLGNLSGNAIAFGEYCYAAAGSTEKPRGPIIGIAIGILTACTLLHMFSRRGGILINNAFAVFKVLFLVAVIILGLIKADGHRLGGAQSATDNFDAGVSFDSDRRDVVSWANSLLYILYTYSGFEQPFYVLSEVKRPRAVFPSATLTAMAMATVLFVLTNVAYFCVIPKADLLPRVSKPMAVIFAQNVFGSPNAKRAMSALIAMSILGNLIVMTFTAARVKQEIAKEGVLPFSLFFSTSYTSPWAWLRNRSRGRAALKHSQETPNHHLERTPIPALGLHWLSSVFLIVVTAMLRPNESYLFLVSLYSYVVIIGFGFVVSGALLYLTFNRRRNWSAYCNFRIPLRPLHALVYFTSCGFLLYAAFAKPQLDSPFSERYAGYPWWIIPMIGQSTWLWGIFWFGLLHLFWRINGVELVVMRVPIIAQEHGHWVQKFEVVTHERHVKVAAPPPPLMQNIEMSMRPASFHSDIE